MNFFLMPQNGNQGYTIAYWKRQGAERLLKWWWPDKDGGEAELLGLGAKYLAGQKFF